MLDKFIKNKGAYTFLAIVVTYLSITIPNFFFNWFNPQASGFLMVVVAAFYAVLSEALNMTSKLKKHGFKLDVKFFVFSICLLALYGTLFVFSELILEGVKETVNA